ncbi:hypothetical protein [Micromonospora sp. NPDC005652]|uniref:hypothetical protein n=1 Tax=Micromonospora sp. NPDC005652 TaxID=3157046 RepID=UPI0033C6042E
MAAPVNNPTLNPRYVAPRGGLPSGIELSRVWIDPNGQLRKHATAVPVDQSTDKPTGTLWCCVGADADGNPCPTRAWTFTEDAVPDPRYCPNHGTPLFDEQLFGGDADPVQGARARATARVRGMLDERKQAAKALAEAKVEALKAEAQRVAQRTRADFKGHAPSAVAGLATVAAGETAVMALDNAILTAALGLGVATAGAVVAYAVAYVVTKLRIRGIKGKSEVGVDRRRREIARRYGVAALASGGWLALAGAAGARLDTPRGCIALLAALLLVWAVCKEHWKELSQRRDRLREMERIRLENAARLEAERLAREAAEEEARRRAAEEVANQPPVPPIEVVPSTAEAKGAWMVQEWQRLGALASMPHGLRSIWPLTRIVPEKTRELTTLSDGQRVGIGWEFLIQGEPGSMSPIAGREDSDLIGARNWIADAMGIERHLVTLVDRPHGQPNTAGLLLSDSAPLGEPVMWKGRAGIRVAPNGALYGHIGRTLLGEDVEECLWAPGRAGGGSTFGVTGSGKSVTGQILLLNRLAAGIFPILHDWKMFFDFSDFVGIFPMGCTLEHAEVIWRSVDAERERRQSYLAQLVITDRHGRVRPDDPEWNIKRDGPPIGVLWEEFHLFAEFEEFLSRLTRTVRLQRATAAMQNISTQGGSLADMGDSTLRDQLNLISMKLHRMSKAQASYAGYNGVYSPADLPPIPGAMLYSAAEGEEIPMRGAFLTRKDVDGSLFDQLYAPDGTLLLPAPELPDATREVFEREGLMDLWRMGQGEGGRERLLADVERTATAVDLSRLADPAPAAANPGGTGLQAKHVLLALIYQKPGCGRADVSYHPMWKQVGWSAYPNPSTITNALNTLKREGKITIPTENVYQPTAEGALDAEKTLAQISGPTQARATGVEAEHQAEVDAERAAVR